MGTASLAQLARAACGDSRDLDACANDVGSRDRLAALALLDPAPHPLATLTAFAVMPAPPAARRARMRAAALAARRALYDAPDDDLIEVLRSHLRARDVAALIDDLEPAPVLRDARALDSLSRLSASGAAAVWGKEGAGAAPDGGDSLSLDDWRDVLVRAAAQSPPHPLPPAGGGARRGDAAELIAGIGADGWAGAPDVARRTLLDAVAFNAQIAVQVDATAWNGMRPDERACLAGIVARPPAGGPPSN